MTKRIRVGLIFGGKSGEHEISLASAQSVVNAINKDKYNIVLIGITKEGRWVLGEHSLKQLIAASPSPLLNNGHSNGHKNGIKTATTDAKDLVPNSNLGLTPVSPLESIDVAFPLLHGPFGEDGTVQGLLELADIPYVGAGVAASAVSMDKALMKAVFRAHGLPTVDWMVILRREWESRPEETIRRIEDTFGYPCFIKPANLGSSVGVSKAHDWDELAQALASAAQYDRKLLAERAAKNVREIECSVLGNDDPVASLPGEVIARREYYDYSAKYAADSGTELVVPADLSPDVAKTIQDLAVRAFRAVDACGMARVDFFVDRVTNQALVSEINTIPGFTAVSMYPKMWEVSGLTYSALIDRLIQLGLDRYADKKKNKTTY